MDLFWSDVPGYSEIFLQRLEMSTTNYVLIFFSSSPRIYMICTLIGAFELTALLLFNGVLVQRDTYSAAPFFFLKFQFKLDSSCSYTTLRKHSDQRWDIQSIIKKLWRSLESFAVSPCIRISFNWLKNCIVYSYIIATAHAYILSFD